MEGDYKPDPLLTSSSSIGLNYTPHTYKNWSIAEVRDNYRPPIRWRTNLDWQSRNILTNILKYFETERDINTFLAKPSQALLRVGLATGIPRGTLTRLRKDIKGLLASGQTEFTRKKKQRRYERKSILCDPESHDMVAHRRELIKMYLNASKAPTSGVVHNKLVELGLFKGGHSSYRRFLGVLGYKLKRTKNLKGDRILFVENHDVQYKKFTYLRDILKFSAEGRPIIYTALAKLARRHFKGNDKSTLKDTTFFKQTTDLFPDVKDEHCLDLWRAIIVHAGTKDQFIKHGYMIWRCIKKLGSDKYDEESNYKKYITWVDKNLIPNLPPNSVVVLNHDSIYDKWDDPAPTQSTSREKMLSWLKSKDIKHDPDAAKVELYELVKRNKKDHSQFAVDALIERAGHTVLRVPPNYSELNPMMGLLVELKGWLLEQAPKKCPRFVDVAKLAVAKVLSIGTSNWKAKVEESLTLAKEYSSYQAPMEKKMEALIEANLGCFDSETDEDNIKSEKESDSAESSESDEEEVVVRSKKQRTFLVGDDLGEPSGSPSTPSQHPGVSGDPLLADDWALDGLVTIKEEPTY